MRDQQEYKVKEVQMVLMDPQGLEDYRALLEALDHRVLLEALDLRVFLEALDLKGLKA